MKRKEKEIRFFKASTKHGFLSNFYPSEIEVDGYSYRTVEHYFQAQKYKESDPNRFFQIVASSSPSQAKAFGRRGEIPKDWIERRDGVMLEGLRAKFRDPELRGKLLQTGEALLIEDSPFDEYWGIGAHGRGENRLGVLLMEVREEIERVEVEAALEREEKLWL